MPRRDEGGAGGLKMPYIEALPGETVQSWVARSRQRIPFSIGEFVRCVGWTGTRKSLLQPSLPMGINALAKHAPERHLFADPSLAARHCTALPYFLYFAAPENRRRLEADYAGDGARAAVRLSLGIARFPIKAVPDRARFCAECVEEDRKNRACSLYYVAHQLPGATLCWRHITPLYDGCASCVAVRPSITATALPGECPSGHRGHYRCDYAVLPLDKEAMAWLAVESAYLLQSTATFKGQASEILRRAACEAYPMGARYDVDALIRAIQSRFGRVLDWLGCRIDQGVWPRRMLQRSQGDRIHPTLRYLLILGALFPSVRDFERYAAAQGPCQSNNGTREESLVREASAGDQAVEARSDGWRKDLRLSLEQFDYKLSVIPSALRVPRAEIEREIIRQRIAVPKRGTSFGRIAKTKYEKVVSAFRSGMDQEAIRRKFRLSSSMIIYFLLWEPGLYQEWDASRSTFKLDRAKAILLEFRDDHPGSGRQEVWAGLYSYTELVAAQDPEWFHATFPRRRSAARAGVPRGPRNDWDAVDALIVRKLADLAERQRSPDVRPVRLSRTGMLAEVGELQRFGQSERSLPDTARALHHLEETREQFHMRRLIWAGRNLVRSVTPLTREALRRESGLTAATVLRLYDAVIRHPEVLAKVPV